MASAEEVNDQLIVEIMAISQAICDAMSAIEQAARAWEEAAPLKNR